MAVSLHDLIVRKFKFLIKTTMQFHYVLQPKIYDILWISYQDIKCTMDIFDVLTHV